VPTIDPIKVTGLREIQASLKAMDDTGKQLRLALNEVAELVVTTAKSRAPSRSGALRGTIRVASTQRTAAVRMGSARVPYAGFIDFGGRVGHERKIRRPFIKDGRILYPSYYGQKAAISELLDKTLTDLCEARGLKVNK
jgi:hypothetical protein